MKIRSSALAALAASAVVIVIGLVLALTGAGLKFSSQAAGGGDMAQMFWVMLAVVVLLFAFGFARYDLPGGLALGAAALHDQLLTLALSAIGGLVFPLSYILPALAAGSALYTCCCTLPVLREARLIGRGVSLRESTREEVAVMAVRKTRPVLLLTLAAALVIFIAFALSGGVRMIGAVLPLLTGIIAACFSAARISPFIWAAAASRSKGRK